MYFSFHETLALVGFINDNIRVISEVIIVGMFLLQRSGWTG